MITARVEGNGNERAVAVEGLKGTTRVEELCLRAAVALGVPLGAEVALWGELRLLRGEETLAEMGVPMVVDFKFCVGEIGGTGGMQKVCVSTALQEPCGAGAIQKTEDLDSTFLVEAVSIQSNDGMMKKLFGELTRDVSEIEGALWWLCAEQNSKLTTTQLAVQQVAAFQLNTTGPPPPPLLSHTHALTLADTHTAGCVCVEYNNRTGRKMCGYLA
jgi:hypothetical protein